MGAVMQDRLARFYEITADDCAANTLEEMFQRIADGEGLPAICQGWAVPYGRVLTWLMADVKRYEVYLRALEVSGHREVQEAKEIADAASPATVGVAKLQVATRFRRAKAHAKELYGEQKSVADVGTLLLDAGLIGFAGALLERLAPRPAFAEVPGRVIDVSSGTDPSADASDGGIATQ